MHSHNRLQITSQGEFIRTSNDWRFQHEGISTLQRQCWDNPTDGCFQEGTQSKLDPKWKRHSSHRYTQLSNSNEPRGWHPVTHQKSQHDHYTYLNTYLNMYPNECTTPGYLSNKLDRLRKITAQGNQLTRLSHYTNTESQCDKKDLPTDLQESWNDRETLSTKFRMNTILSIICMITTQYLMSEHSSDSISNRLAWPEKKTSQKKYITRLKGYNNTEQLCDRESLLTDLPESWSHKEPLYNRYRLSNHGDKIIPVIHIHKELYILSRPSKAMAQWKFQHVTQKEVYILSRPSKLQPTLLDCGTPSLQSMADCSIASPLQLITQHTPREKDLPQLPSTLGAQEMYDTHQELIRRQQNKPEKLHWTHSRYACMGTTKAKYILGTSYSCEPM